MLKLIIYILFCGMQDLIFIRGKTLGVAGMLLWYDSMSKALMEKRKFGKAVLWMP